jgi:soluble lytic murein transglycosylase-like protein
MQRRLVPTHLFCLLSATTPAAAGVGHVSPTANSSANFLVIEHPASTVYETGRTQIERLPGSSFGSVALRSQRPGFVRTLDRTRALILATELRLGLPTGLLDALVAEESGYSAGAVSRRGAMGLAQLMPRTARSLGLSDPFDALSNVDAGGRYLRDLLRRFGSIALALAAYNAGPQAVARAGGIPPFPETRRYVVKIMARWSVSSRSLARARIASAEGADLGGIS